MTTLYAIKPRKPSFDVRDVPVFWNDGDPVLTRFFDALSVHFPDGERFFIQSVRNYQDRVTDPKLKEDIRSFFRQEAQHGIVHDTYNANMAAQGVNVDKIIARFKVAIRLFQTHLSPKYQLALTAAFEHITATLGEGFLEGEGEMFRHAHPVMRAMFLWHGVEEVEHKAVAFDVYETAAGGGYFTRATALLGGTAVVHVVVGSVAWHMLKVDGMNRRPLLLAKGLYRLYGPRGLLTRLVPRYLAWFRPGFHPMDSGMPEKVEVWLAEYQKHEDPMLASDTVFGDKALAQAA
ncbi:MAG TPA: metal-dependent hydrolase [Anaerolineales bacterium]|nr:metal-dependent hydrolase [Anaerolineales bacterium]